MVTAFFTFVTVSVLVAVIADFAASITETHTLA